MFSTRYMEAMWYMFPNPIKIGEYELKYDDMYAVGLGPDFKTQYFIPAGSGMRPTMISAETRKILDARSIVAPGFRADQLCTDIDESSIGTADLTRSATGEVVRKEDLPKPEPRQTKPAMQTDPVDSSVLSNTPQVMGSDAPTGDQKYFLRSLATRAFKGETHEALTYFSRFLESEYRRTGLQPADLRVSYPALSYLERYLTYYNKDRDTGEPYVIPHPVDVENKNYRYWFIGEVFDPIFSDNRWEHEIANKAKAGFISAGAFSGTLPPRLVSMFSKSEMSVNFLYDLDRYMASRKTPLDTSEVIDVERDYINSIYLYGHEAGTIAHLNSLSKYTNGMTFVSYLKTSGPYVKMFESVLSFLMNDCNGLTSVSTNAYLMKDLNPKYNVHNYAIHELCNIIAYAEDNGHPPLTDKALYTELDAHYTPNYSKFIKQSNLIVSIFGSKSDFFYQAPAYIEARNWISKGCPNADSPARAYSGNWEPDIEGSQKNSAETTAILTKLFNGTKDFVDSMEGTEAYFKEHPVEAGYAARVEAVLIPYMYEYGYTYGSLLFFKRFLRVPSFNYERIVDKLRAEPDQFAAEAAFYFMNGIASVNSKTRFSIRDTLQRKDYTVKSSAIERISRQLSLRSTVSLNTTAEELMESHKTTLLRVLRDEIYEALNRVSANEMLGASGEISDMRAWIKAGCPNYKHPEKAASGDWSVAEADKYDALIAAAHKMIPASMYGEDELLSNLSDSITASIHKRYLSIEGKEATKARTFAFVSGEFFGDESAIDQDAAFAVAWADAGFPNMEKVFLNIRNIEAFAPLFDYALHPDITATTVRSKLRTLYANSSQNLDASDNPIAAFVSAYLEFDPDIQIEKWGNKQKDIIDNVADSIQNYIVDPKLESTVLYRLVSGTGTSNTFDPLQYHIDNVDVKEFQPSYYQDFWSVPKEIRNYMLPFTRTFVRLGRVSFINQMRSDIPSLVDLNLPTAKLPIDIRYMLCLLKSGISDSFARNISFSFPWFAQALSDLTTESGASQWDKFLVDVNDWARASTAAGNVLDSDRPLLAAMMDMLNTPAFEIDFKRSNDATAFMSQAIKQIGSTGLWYDYAKRTLDQAAAKPEAQDFLRPDKSFKPVVKLHGGSGSATSYVKVAPKNPAEGVHVDFMSMYSNQKLHGIVLNKMYPEIGREANYSLLPKTIAQDLTNYSKHLGLKKPLNMAHSIFTIGHGAGSWIMNKSYGGQVLLAINIDPSQLEDLFGCYNTSIILHVLTHEIAHYIDKSHLKNTERMRFEKECRGKKLYLGHEDSAGSTTNKLTEQFAVLAEFMVWGDSARHLYFTNGVDSVMNYFVNNYMSEEMLAHKKI